MIFDENDCCGNGCSNCILDIKPYIEPFKNFSNKTNCLLKYRKYKLVQKTILTSPEILKLKFILHSLNLENDKKLTIHLPPGHHIMMKYNEIRRPYSPFSVDAENIEFEFLVNLKPNGEMSKYIKLLGIDDFVEFIGPIGSIYHKPNEHDNLIIFTQGIAIAPTIRIVEEILNNEDDDTRVYFVGCFTNLDSFYLREKILNFKQFWNFNSYIYLSREHCISCPEIKYCEHFRNKLKYKESINLNRLVEEDITKLPINLNSKIIICGSKEFENFIKSCLNNCKVNENFINVL